MRSTGQRRVALQGRWHAPAGDAGGKAQVVEGGAGGFAVVSGVQVAGALCGQDVVQLVLRCLQRGDQQRGVVPVGACSGEAQRDAVALGGHHPSVSGRLCTGPPARARRSLRYTAPW